MDDSDILKVWYLQDTLCNGAPVIGDRFGIASPNVIHTVGKGTCLPDFYKDIQVAKREGVLAGRESEWLVTTDMIMWGRDCGGAEVYVVAVAAFEVSSDDVDRALYCAELFGKVYPGRDARAALWYVKADEGCRNAAESKGVELVRTWIKWLEEG